MEWLVKNRAAINKITDMYLCSGDAGGAIKMIAEVKSDFAVKVGDLLAFAECALLY